MTRMVDEQRLQIGTLKALGYTNLDISKKFLVYASLASVLGTIIGLLIGYQVFPGVIFNAYGSLYNLPDIRITYYISYGLISFIIAIFCTVVSAYAATRVALQSNAATLMRPKAPKIGKRILLERIPFIWNRMGFIQKVTARNLFRYKQRMLMTVLGVAGCTALILTGFGLSDSIADISSLQYGKVNKYEAIVAFNADAIKEDKVKYEDFIDSQASIKNNLNVLQEAYTISEKGVNTQDVTVFVPEDTEQLSKFVVLNDRKSGELYSLPDEGAIVTEKLAKLFDLKIERFTHNLLGKDYILDIGINHLEVEDKNHDTFYNQGTISEKGDLSTFYGYETLDATGYRLIEGKVYPKTIQTMKDLEAMDIYALLKSGYTYVRLAQFSQNDKDVSLPINILDNDQKVPGFFVNIGNNPNFVLQKDGKVDYAVVNGFLINLNTKESNFKNAIFYK